MRCDPHNCRPSHSCRERLQAELWGSRTPSPVFCYQTNTANQPPALCSEIHSVSPRFCKHIDQTAVQDRTSWTFPRYHSAMKTVNENNPTETTQ
jgi:hypothetical protein